MTLTPENKPGVDTKTYPIIKATDPAVGFEEEATAETTSYAVDNFLFMEFAAESHCTVSVYTTNGTLAAQQDVNAGADRLMSTALDPKGVYMVKIASEQPVPRGSSVIHR